MRPESQLALTTSLPRCRRWQGRRALDGSGDSNQKAEGGGGGSVGRVAAKLGDPCFKEKGDIHDCGNYKRIKLMSYTTKMWERVSAYPGCDQCQGISVWV